MSRQSSLRKQESGSAPRAFQQGETECGDAWAVRSQKQEIAASLASIAISRRDHVVVEHEGGEKTRDELYAEARRRDIPGRSKMSKSALERALSR